MTKFEIRYPQGATPLDPNEMDGLIPTYISTQGELNSLERDNIVEALSWAGERKHPDLLSASFVFALHKKMFGRVWTWAGKMRQSGKNIGVPAEQIHTQLCALFGDARYWIENRTFPWDEISTRFHHRLVQIHAFPNGNGRHARLMTDLLMEANGQERFSWGMSKCGSPIETEGPTREEYIQALREADKSSFDRLIRFARS